MFGLSLVTEETKSQVQTTWHFSFQNPTFFIESGTRLDIKSINNNIP